MTGFESFLTEALPMLGLSPSGCRRRVIRRRIVRRMEQLGFHEFDAYLRHLRSTPEECELLRPLLTVTISRFYRNRRTFDALGDRVLPLLASGGETVRAWSAGCASGEEAYTLRIVWEERGLDPARLRVTATDIDGPSLARARAARYDPSSLREVPPEIAARHFRREQGKFRVSDPLRAGVTFFRHDLQREDPPGAFDLVLCRNTAFTYFDLPDRLRAAGRIASALSPGGFLVIGRTEALPGGAERWFAPCAADLGIHRLRAPDGWPRSAGPVSRPRPPGRPPSPSDPP